MLAFFVILNPQLSRDVRRKTMRRFGKSRSRFNLHSHQWDKTVDLTYAWSFKEQWVKWQQIEWQHPGGDRLHCQISWDLCALVNKRLKVKRGVMPFRTPRRLNGRKSFSLERAKREKKVARALAYIERKRAKKK